MLTEIPELPTLEKAGPSVNMEEINENEVKLKFDDAISEKNEKSDERKDLEKSKKNTQEIKEVKEFKSTEEVKENKLIELSKESKIIEEKKENLCNNKGEIKMIIEEEKENINLNNCKEKKNMKEESNIPLDSDMEGNVESDDSAVVQMLRSNPLARLLMQFYNHPGDRTKSSFANMEQPPNKPYPEDDEVEENSQVTSLDGVKKIKMGSMTPNSNHPKIDLQILTNLDESRTDSKLGEALPLLYDILKITEDQSNNISKELNELNNRYH